MYEYDRNPKSQYAAEMARRRQIARSRCRPGERWLPSIGKCAGIGGGNAAISDIGGDIGGNMANSGGKSGNSANKAIMMEVAMRKSQGLDQA